MIPARVFERALAHTEPGSNGCILSTYSTASHGYAQIGWGEDGMTHMRLVHRVVWEFHNGAIPLDRTIDHICRERRCCNIKHLRLLSNRVNGTLNGNSQKTHCPHGHEYTADNTSYRRHRSGRIHRFCRACQRIANGKRPSRLR